MGVGRFGHPDVQRDMQRLTNWERHQVMKAFGKKADPKQSPITPERLAPFVRRLRRLDAHEAERSRLDGEDAS